MAKQGKQPTRSYDAPVEPGDIDTLLACMIHSREVRARVRELIRPEFFEASELGKATAIRVIGNLPDRYDKEDKLPRIDLESLLRKEFASFGRAMPDDQRADVLEDPIEEGDDYGIVHHAYTNVDRSQFSIEAVDQLIGRFVLERGGVAPLKKALAAGAGYTPSDLGSLLDEYRAIETKVAAIGKSKRQTFATTPIATVTEGQVKLKLSWLGNFSNGFWAAGEIIGLLGGTGWGKSTLAHQITMSVASQLQSDGGHDDKKMRSALAFSYEDPGERIMIRGLACAARIRKEKLEAMKDPEKDLSRVHTDYDAAQARLEDQSLEDFGTEYSRYHAAVNTMRRNYFYYDMTESGSGDGGVDEIVGLIEQSIRETGQRPGFVLIDSIDLLAAAWITKNNPGADLTKELAVQIPRLVANIRSRIGVAYKCPVLVTNQLKGAALKLDSMANLDHSDGASSKSWGKALDHHLMLCKPSPGDKVSRLVCTKDRRSGHDGEQVMIMLDGKFGRWVAATNFAVVDGNIVDKEVAETVQGPTKQRRMPKTSADYEDLDYI